LVALRLRRTCRRRHYKLSRRRDHAPKLKRESKSEKQFFAVDVTAIDSL
jgi:hypothetical protein